MALILQRARARIAHPLTRRITAIAAILLVVLLLHQLGPAPQPQSRAGSSAAEASQGETGLAYTQAAVPYGPPAPVTIEPGHLPSVMAADLKQAAAYLSSATSPAATTDPGAAQPSATAAASPSGPSLQDLLVVQARLGTAQLILQSLLQPATEDQLAAAQAAVGQAESALETAQTQAETETAAATPTDTPDASRSAQGSATAQYAQAQQAVGQAQAALQRAQHPYTDDEINAAKAQFAQAQAALASAQQAAARPVATQAPAAAAADAQPAATDTSQDAAAQAPLLSSIPNPSAAAIAGDSGAQQTVLSSIPNPSAAAIAGSGLAATATAAPVPTAAPPPATRVAAPAPAPRVAEAGAGAAPSSGAADLSAAVTAAKQRLTDAQARVNLYTAAPDAGQVQQAQDSLAAAQQRLASLPLPSMATPVTAALANAADGTTSTAEPEADTAAAATAADPVQAAQGRLVQAQQELYALSDAPNPATISAARTELASAQQAFQNLYNQADPALQSRLDPDPQTAIAKVAPLDANWLRDLTAQIGQIYLQPGISDIFVRQISVESGGFSPDVVSGRIVSSAGAAGVAQLLPSSYPDVNALNPVAGLMAAAATMRDNLASYGGDVRKALAAYNAGGGRVDAAIADGGPNWESELPAETQLYLQLILGSDGG